MKQVFRMILGCGTVALLLLPAAQANDAKGVLESPRDGSVQSGIGVFYGWHCDAKKIELVIDDRPPKEAAYGTKRNDTKNACGDTDNGFGLLWSYNLFGPGKHTVVALADGVEFDRATFTVELVSQEKATKEDIPESAELLLAGYEKEVIVEWNEATQNFVITKVADVEIPLDQIMAFVAGDWVGSWYSKKGTETGGLFITFEAIENDGRTELVPTALTMAGTSCAETVVNASPVDVNDLLFNVEMKNGSTIEFEFRITDNLSGGGGIFLIDSGPCEGKVGTFVMHKK